MLVCVCCSNASLETWGGKKPCLQLNVADMSIEKWLHCRHCGCSQLLAHAFDMLECIDKNASKTSRDRNPWYFEVKVLWQKSCSAANNPDREHYISHCIKCEFKSLIGNKRITSSLHVPCGAKISTSNTLLAMSVNDSNLQTSDCVNHHRKDDLLAIRKSYLGAVQPDHDCLLFLQDYFGTSPFRTIPYDRAKLISEFNDSQTKRSNRHSKHVGLNNVCSGAVIVTDSKIIIQSQDCNNGECSLCKVLLQEKWVLFLSHFQI